MALTAGEVKEFEEAEATLLAACSLYASGRAASSVASASSNFLISRAVSAIDLDGADRRPAEAHDLKNLSDALLAQAFLAMVHSKAICPNVAAPVL